MTVIVGPWVSGQQVVIGLDTERGGWVAMVDGGKVVDRDQDLDELRDRHPGHLGWRRAG